MRAHPRAVFSLLVPDQAELLSLANTPSSPSAARRALSSRVDQQVQPGLVVSLRVVTAGSSRISRNRVGKRAHYHGSGVSVITMAGRAACSSIASTACRGVDGMVDGLGRTWNVDGF